MGDCPTVLAGFWFGLWGGLVFGAVAAVISSIELGVLVGVAVWAIEWPMMGLAIKHRWGLRPDFEVPTRFSLHQLMAQMSDRWLSFGMWFFGFSAVVLTLDPGHRDGYGERLPWFPWWLPSPRARHPVRLGHLVRTQTAFQAITRSTSRPDGV
jgi:hypothetical protein